MAHIGHMMKHAVARALLSRLYGNLADPSVRAKTLMKVADMLPKFYREASPERVESVKAMIRDPDNRFMKLDPSNH